jgi:cysteine desulfurase
MSPKIYLDWNSTSPLHPTVQASIKSALHHYGNPSSLHQTGQASRELIETARDKVAALIGAHPHQIIFTSSGSEANNMVIKHPFASTPRTSPLPRIITTSIEHSSILTPCQFLSQTHVQPVTYLAPTPQGIITPDSLASEITPDTALISIMMANNETGSINPINALSQVNRPKNTLFHTDATQAAGKLPINVQTLNIDLLTLSAHKIQGPKGIAAVYIRKDDLLTPLLHGGSQEQRLRAGTENLLGVIAFGIAADLAKANQDSNTAHSAQLKSQLIAGLSQIDNIHINTPENSLPNTLNISILGIPAEAMVMRMDQEGIEISTGSACSTGSTEPSHVLKAITTSKDIQMSAIRISTGPTTTSQEIDTVITLFKTIIPKLRQHHA